MEPKATKELYLLEIDLVSAQGLKTPMKLIPMRTKSYVVSYIEPARKLRSRVDKVGRKNPTWNDKFYFTVDSDELRRNMNKAVVFEIYCARFLHKDKLVGTARVLLDGLVHCSNRYKEEGMRGTFRAYQIRRPDSDEAKGILNIGVRLLEGASYEVMSEFVGMRNGNIDHNKLMGTTNKFKGGFFKSLYHSLLPRRKPNISFKHNP